MAILQGLEPSVSEKDEEAKNQRQKHFSIWSKKQFKFFKGTNLVDLKNKLVFFVGKILDLPEYFNSWYKNNVKFLPHAAIVFLLVIVLVSNFTQSAEANSQFVDFSVPTPDEQVAIVASVDDYTPLLPNGAEAVDKYLTAQTDTNGFATSVALVSTQITQRTTPLPDNTAQAVSYTVQSGDSLSRIAMLFNTSSTVLKYYNNLDSADAIKPGITLKIPSQDYAITSAMIAKQAADKAKKLAAAAAKNNTVAVNNSSKVSPTVKYSPGSSVNAYPYGWCTYYVATRRYVPGNWGNARSWLSSARAAGYSTGRTPVVGAIYVSSESSLGHVAYVENVNNDDGTFVISEMNATRGWGRTDSRTIKDIYGKIMGFIY